MYCFELGVNVVVKFQNVVNASRAEVHCPHCLFNCPVWNKIKCLCKININNMEFTACVFGRFDLCNETVYAKCCFFAWLKSILCVWDECMFFNHIKVAR